MNDYVDGPVTMHLGDALEVLRQLPSESVHCVVTSPPYWRLRDYGTGEWEGGEVGCDHREIRGGNGQASAKQVTSAGTQGYQARESCRRCGARRIDSQLGLEPTPELYVEHMAEVFREVRRVLRRDGTLWLNLGDSYAANRTYQVRDNKHVEVGNDMAMAVPVGLKPKDLVGVPWRVAVALQVDGWYLRSDIIWSKPNPMPESVTDRPTKSHEYLFLLTKSAKYYYDAEAVREPAEYGYREWTGRLVSGTENGDGHRSSVGTTKGADPSAGRNLRSVWTIATQPYPEAHFATFPEDLVIPCIKAGCSETGIVLDPFVGSGTTLAVARRLGRRSIGIELQAEYLPLIRKRVEGSALPLLEALEVAGADPISRHPEGL